MLRYALFLSQSKAQKAVSVARVNLKNGGKAIVGNVSHGGRVEDEK